MTRHRVLLISILISCGFVQAFAGKKKAPPPEPTTVKLSIDVPSLAALAETSQSQAKEGVRITVQQESYEAKDRLLTRQRPASPPSFFGLVAAPSPNAIYVERIFTPNLTVHPDRLIFHLHVSNQMPRVFRGAGIVVQFNVAGKIMATDPAGYGDLINLIIPPRSEQEVAVLGPPIADIPAPCTIGFFLYDVVTNIDQAGNVTNKQNFEWYFSYQKQTQEKEITVPAPERGWMTP